VRHGKKSVKFGRERSHRRAMMFNMVTSLLAHEHVSTTNAKGKELKRQAEHMITFAKRGDLHSRRQVLRHIADKSVVGKLFDELGPRYSERNGGYTRPIKIGPRRGDGAEMCIVELVDRQGEDVPEAASGTPDVAEETVTDES